MSKAYVLLSGGIDSTVALAIARRDYGVVTAVGIEYGQLHNRELVQAQQVAIAMGADFLGWNLEGVVAKGGLTDPDLEVPKVPYSELPPGVSPTYVPFRNGILLSVIAGIASIDVDARAIFFGAHADDAENWAYPDCTPEFVGAMAAAVYVGTYHKVRLITPFLNLAKHEIITIGDKLKVPWHLTWSCYIGGIEQCGVCSTCQARREAFRLAEVNDPTTYVVDKHVSRL